MRIKVLGGLLGGVFVPGFAEFIASGGNYWIAGTIIIQMPAGILSGAWAAGRLERIAARHPWGSKSIVRAVLVGWGGVLLGVAAQFGLLLLSGLVFRSKCRYPISGSSVASDGLSPPTVADQWIGTLYYTFLELAPTFLCSILAAIFLLACIYRWKR